MNIQMHNLLRLCVCVCVCVSQLACGTLVPDQGANLYPIVWEHRVLTPGPLGKSPGWFLKTISYGYK